MDTFDFVIMLLVAILSIIMIVKFFQMTSDIRQLKEHFVKANNRSESNIGQNEEIKGTIRKNGVTYKVYNGSTMFSDGKSGLITYLGNGKVSVNIAGEDKSFNDVYYAAEALHDYLSNQV